MTMPDFDEWARLNFPRSSSLDQQRMGSYLKQAFEQGRVLGHREGYEEGLNKGWSDQMDKEYKDREGACNNDDR